MSKVIIYTDPADGFLKVVHPAPRAIEPGKTEDDLLATLALTVVPANAIGPRIVDVENLPKSREFRGAWCDVTEKPDVDIDMDRACQISLERIRARRNQVLQATDVPFAVAVERGDTKAAEALKAKRQALRDLPATLNLGRHKTPEALLKAEREAMP